jgi:cytochrome P450
MPTPLAVSQHLIGKVLRRGRPNRPEKREPNLEDRSSRPQLLDRAGWVAKIVRTISDNMLTIDEPDHTRLRAIVDEAFHRRAVLEMEPRILAIAGELADEHCHI